MESQLLSLQCIEKVTYSASEGSMVMMSFNEKRHGGETGPAVSWPLKTIAIGPGQAMHHVTKKHSLSLSLSFSERRLHHRSACVFEKKTEGEEERRRRERRICESDELHEYSPPFKE